MAQWLRIPVAYATELIWFPVPTWWLKTLCNFSYREYDELFWPVLVLCAHGIPYTQSKHKHMWNKTNNCQKYFKWEKSCFGSVLPWLSVSRVHCGRRIWQRSFVHFFPSGKNGEKQEDFRVIVLPQQEKPNDLTSHQVPPPKDSSNSK